MEKDKQVDILCIGDTVVEPFIKLQNAEVHCQIDNSNCTITLPFGAKIPFENVTELYGVGNSANASVSISRLGLKSGIATELGEDENGRRSLENFVKEKVDITNVNLHKNIPTNYHYVLWYPPERTILVKHNSFPKKLDVNKINSISPKFIYLSSLPADSLSYHNELISWLKENRQTKLIFQPGTFQMKLGVETLKPLYTMCFLYIVNKEEAQYILGTNESDINILLEKVQKLGPEIVAITDGPLGSYLRVNNKNYFLPPYPDPKPPLERTGAGDAFASTLAAYIAKGFSPEEAILRAPINSMSVVQEIGAQKGLLEEKEIEELLKKAPNDYKLKEL